MDATTAEAPQRRWLAQKRGPVGPPLQSRREDMYEEQDGANHVRFELEIATAKWKGRRLCAEV
jgi:hypothetical protein